MPTLAYCVIAYLAGSVSALLMVFYVGRRESRRADRLRDEAIARRAQQTHRSQLWVPRSAVAETVPRRDRGFNMGEDNDAKS